LKPELVEMAIKPENNFLSKINQKLPKTLYREKNYNPLRRGTPDVWYSGGKGDLWVEYKFLTKPTRIIDPLKLLSPLQAKWLKDRKDEGRNVAVVIGTPAGGVFLQGQAMFQPISKDRLTLSCADLALQIERQTLHGSNSVSNEDSLRSKSGS
jgi:hypothetical protein